MGRKLELEIAETLDELKNALLQARRASSKERLQMLYWLKTGQVSSRTEIAKRLNRDVATITRWLQKYRQAGIKELLCVRKAPGKKPILTPEQLEKLKQKLAEEQGFKSYGEVQKWLREELGVNLAYPTVYKVVRYQLKAKLKVPRPKSNQQNPLSKSHFKKTLPDAVKVLQDVFGHGQTVRYMCQDETRLGLKTIGGRLITSSGVKPIGVNQWKRDNFYLYGVVEPLTGDSFFYEFSHLDGDCFQIFLNLLSKEIGSDLVILQLDQASCHTMKTLEIPENIIPIYQPPHCPELNPIERFWQYIKSKLKWSNCQTLNKLRQKLSEVLKSITPSEISDLTCYTFILEALFSAAS